MRFMSCKRCGWWFHALFAQRRYCSVECRDERHKEDMRDRYKNSEEYRTWKQTYARERARELARKTRSMA